ncbi:uncharacterized protein Z518_04423 [Rhinocladiella mackenziei CBS 650.93]|uniref:Rhinocladiella mackenziei CBS 650.93 unplaced genomic scaffold supercont1.3, whole genome shotgun sequence n=1 Tax=Rhinocladiella mackenziei CBS 650.93 TaxID=1442369 RepID=A0A0D2FWA6_9EURO|nr:uncharacterized protein Z518_04423 [Rhinocladiella mackenziei CBS 650.93]KIX06447.1 hypothetical protein Z518_04423 [Rhinocladiella mackenziei CBS 650.93]
MVVSTISAPLMGKTAIITRGSKGIVESTGSQFVRKGYTAIAITSLQDDTAANSVLLRLRDIDSIITTAAIKGDCCDGNFSRQVHVGQSPWPKNRVYPHLVSNASLRDINAFKPVDQTQ